MMHLVARKFSSLSVTVFCLVAGATITSIGTAASATNSQVPLCTGSDLLGAYAGYGAATGNFIYDVVLINVGHTSCRLNGYPTIQGINGGRTFNLHISKHGTFAGNLLPTELSPRMSGRLLLSTADNCNALNLGGTSEIERVAAAHTYSHVSIRLLGSALEVDVPGLTIDVACGLEVSRMGWSSN
jgi:hypothetical protein